MNGYIHWQPDEVVKHKIGIKGVIHVGAHYGQEYKDYVKYGIKRFIMFEPLKDNFAQLLEYVPPCPEVQHYQMALGNATGEVEMYVETANWGQSSSILEPGIHMEAYPQIIFDKRETVKIDKLDNIEFDRSLYNMLNIDVQGYELEVMKGAAETLKHIDIIYTEINTGQVYKGCAQMWELDVFLKPYGFKRVYTHEYDGIYYGDAVYVKK